MRQLGVRLLNFFAAKGAVSDSLRARGSNIGKNLIVDLYGRRVIAAAVTGNLTNLHVFGAAAG